jgi:hypothetical protein
MDDSWSRRNRAADAVEMFVDEGIEVAMNRFNQSPVEGGTSPVDEDSR